MNDIADRLIDCFQTVFPEIPAAEIPNATQASVAAWDSAATITLLNVIEDEFEVQLDLDLLPELTSFGSVHEHLCQQMQS
jgi:acyl carrier protein